MCVEVICRVQWPSRDVVLLNFIQLVVPVVNRFAHSMNIGSSYIPLLCRDCKLHCVLVFQILQCITMISNFYDLLAEFEVVG